MELLLNNKLVSYIKNCIHLDQFFQECMFVQFSLTAAETLSMIFLHMYCFVLIEISLLKNWLFKMVYC